VNATKISTALTSHDTFMSSPIYYIADQTGATSGPFTASAVLKMRTENEPSAVTDDTFIWQEGTADWQSFSSLKESLEIVSKSDGVVVKHNKPTGVSDVLLAFAELLDQVPRRYQKLLKITDSMESLDKDTAERLISVADSSEPLSFDALTEIEPDVAEVLASHKGTLFLNIKTIVPPLSAALAKHRTDLEDDFLGLNGVEVLDDVSSLELSKHEGYLSLEGLKDFTPAVVEMLATHKGRIDLCSENEISQEILSRLKTNPHLCFC